ncbi:MAG: cytochrome c family protein [Rhodospirillaceae bacterium]
MKMLTRALVALYLCAGVPALADTDLGPGDVGAGRVYAQQSCSDCHNIASRRSPLLSILSAPDFYLVANAKTTTLMGLNVFLSSPHRKMPNFIISDEDRRNVVAYIMSLRAPPKVRP